MEALIGKRPYEEKKVLQGDDEVKGPEIEISPSPISNPGDISMS